MINHLCIQTNDTTSPAAIGTIGSANPGADTFAGNGNLNPPVRQSGKMANMQIRTKFGTLGGGKTQFNSPHGFCLGMDEEIIIADTNNHRIQVFDKNGEYKYSFGSPGREEGQVKDRSYSKRISSVVMLFDCLLEQFCEV